MGQTTFSGPVRSLAGFIETGPNNVLNLANGTNTITLDVANYAGRMITTNDATLVITLPTINVSTNENSDTENNQGAEFFIFIETAATAVKITTNGTDKFVGSIVMVDTDSSGAVTAFAPAAANDTINFNGTTTGGIAGSWVKITVLKTAKYLVTGIVLASGAVVTPFADS